MKNLLIAAIAMVTVAAATEPGVAAPFPSAAIENQATASSPLVQETRYYGYRGYGPHYGYRGYGPHYGWRGHGAHYGWGPHYNRGYHRGWGPHRHW